MTGNELNIFDELDFPESGLINQKRVTELFNECLDDGRKKSILVEGVHKTYMLSHFALITHKEEILEMLCNLPDEFKATLGKGWSLVNGCEDKNGDQWASTHEIVEQLFIMGIALNLVQYLLPRMMWKALPYGLPFYIIAV